MIEFSYGPMYPIQDINYMAKKKKTENKARSSASMKSKKSSRGKGKKSASTPESNPVNFRAAVDFAKSEKGRKVFALSTILFNVFLFVSILSYFFNGHIDQSLIESGEIADADPANWMGYLGAKFGFFFVTRGFGVMSLLIPMFGALLGFAMLENQYYKFTFKVFRYALFGMLWGSVFMGFMTLAISDKTTNLGGGFGGYVNEGMFTMIGAPGMAILIVLAAAIFVVVTFNVKFSLLQWAETAIPTKSESEEALVMAGAEVTTADGIVSETVVADPESTIEEEKKEEKDYILGVTPVNEKQETKDEKNQGDIKLEIPDEEKLDKPAVLEVPVEEAPVDPTAELELVISEGDQEVLDSIAPDPEADNIVKKDEMTFEKFVPETDKETLEEDDDVGDWDQYDPTKELSNYSYPTLDLLKSYDNQKKREVNRTELEENKNKIIQTLKHYKIDITHIKATIGPTVTLYEIVPAPGIRISRIRNLEDDIALSLAALGIRIIAPIPGKGTIGIEIPNSNPEIVSMRSTLGTEKFRDTKAELPLALGRTISNEVYIADLSKMPHLLIAGATGQGKSVGINGIISSILYKKHPAYVKFVLIDPKKVELNLYAALEKHFLAKLANNEDAIITDTKQVIGVLNSLCIEMDERYDLLKRAKVRNLREYNDKFLARRLNPKKGHRFMPYIVLVIDEFADLMMTAGKEIEGPIARLAQLARAIGIHLILATQRPSVNVITGIIKANFPARISFRVTSKVDSRTILDTGGADQLIGRGDMLFSTGSDLVRIQNSFIDTPEVDEIVNHIANQQGYFDAYHLPEPPEEEAAGGELSASERDQLFEEAARLIVRHQQGSTSLIQRRLSLGYNRAGRIIDQLERAGIVGPFSGSKARDVLVGDEVQLEQILSGLG